jgi:argininosuccinate lyase
MNFRTAHSIVGRIAASGTRPGLAELDEIALETAGFRASATFPKRTWRGHWTHEAT